MDYGLKMESGQIQYLGRDVPKEMTKGIRRRMVPLEPNSSEVDFWTEHCSTEGLWYHWCTMETIAKGWGTQTAFDSMRQLRSERDEARLALQKALRRIAYLERRLIVSALDTPTQPYDPHYHRLPFVSPESPFPSDLDPSDEDEE